MNKIYSPVRALELLRLGSGRKTATFRDGQEEAISHVAEGKGRLLVVQKTGWGKSFVYFISIKLLRDAGQGPAILVSPLLALMRNQIEAAERMGVRAASINSENPNDWADVEARIQRDEIDILLISPERLANQHFQFEVLASVADKISLLVVDEAHCISDWGHDFRPHYRLLERFVKNMPPNMRLLATTATANNRVMKDLETVLGPNLIISRGDLNRPSLTLQTIRLPNKAQRLAWLADQLLSLSGHGIIYTLTVRDANQVSDWLKSQGFKVEAYTGETENRPALEQALLENRVKALVATTALGMGYDKPDLSFVIHYQMPSSVVAYYQQVGRAGRALDAAYGVLLSGEEEDDIANWFIQSAFPTRKEVADVIENLDANPNGLSVDQLLRKVNISKGRVEKTISLLSLESPAPIAKVDTKWQLTAAILSENFWRRAERLTALRWQEQEQMKYYVSLPFGQHMPFLIKALDGDPVSKPRQNLPALTEQVSQKSLQKALAFLRRSHLSIKPRKKWPSGGLEKSNVRGNIGSKHQAESGMALCVYGEAGLGKIVKSGKSHEHHFADDLVEACVAMLEEWAPQPTPTWVTCVPSLRHPKLVPDFALRLAEALQLPFNLALMKIEATPEQQFMNNSAQQALNIEGSLVPKPENILSEPVLLIDDVVESGWTLTIATWLLRKNGSGEVWPLVLSKAGP